MNKSWLVDDYFGGYTTLDNPIHIYYIHDTYVYIYIHKLPTKLSKD